MSRANKFANSSVARIACAKHTYPASFANNVKCRSMDQVKLLTFMDIINQLKKLNFPEGEYIVVGSALMGLLGLKICNDLDIIVTPRLFEELKSSGEWDEVPWTYLGKTDQSFLRKGSVEIYLDVNCADFQPTFSELLGRAIIYAGFTFVSLQDTLEFKRRYVLTKPKHTSDIVILESYLLNSPTIPARNS